MAEYTWVVNLLREIEVFANDSKLTGLSENLALACTALIADTQDKATIDPSALRWLEGAATRRAGHGSYHSEKIIYFPR